VIAPIRSRCLCLRVAAPTVEEVSSVLLAVAHKEGVKCPPALAERIARASDRNLRRAVLTLEACKVRRATDTKPESRADDDPIISRPAAPASSFAGAAVPDG
jgi:replication factor C subunit 3/5